MGQGMGMEFSELFVNSGCCGANADKNKKWTPFCVRSSLCLDREKTDHASLSLLRAASDHNNSKGGFVRLNLGGANALNM